MTVQCCKCKRVRVNNQWFVEHSITQGPISHTFCPVCFEAIQREMRIQLVARRVLEPVAKAG